MFLNNFKKALFLAHERLQKFDFVNAVVFRVYTIALRKPIFKQKVYNKRLLNSVDKSLVFLFVLQFCNQVRKCIE